jgi:predicted TIM-barrel fold metal-dependent hydrolase
VNERADAGRLPGAGATVDPDADAEALLEIPCCLPERRGLTSLPLPGLDDEDGARVAADLPPIVDSHVHLFPPRVFEAIWRWFDRHGWPIRYRLQAPAVLEHLLSRGVEHVVGLHYAHKPGIARFQNEFMATLQGQTPQLTATATVYPGEDDAVAIVEDAFAQGLWGLKLHCHVQAMPADDARLFDVYRLCEERGAPVVIHAGREPWSEALPCDPHVLCDVARVERVVALFPKLRLVIPHLGADEFAAYAALMRRVDTVWLDTTMMVGGFFDTGDVTPYIRARPDRVLYGSDFPNLPYAWDRELRSLAADLDDATLAAVLGDNARVLWEPPRS